MTQDKKKEISFFDQFIEKNHEYVGLSEKSYKKLLFELSKSLTTFSYLIISRFKLKFC